MGPPLKCVEVSIGENDELLVRGPSVMMGYWHNKTATQDCIDSEGWLHTGDKVRIDEQGRIFITGRIKEIIVLSNGEKVPPNDMELAISMDPLFEQVLVMGEGKPYLTTLVVLNPRQWQSFRDSLGVDGDNGKALADEKVINAALKRVSEQIKGFPGYAQIQRIALTLEPWTIENGLITPTLKVKRQFIMERFADSIDQLYAGHASPNNHSAHAHTTRKQQTA